MKWKKAKSFTDIPDLFNRDVPMIIKPCFCDTGFYYLYKHITLEEWNSSYEGKEYIASSRNIIQE